MAKVFDIKKRKFVELETPKSRSRLLEIPEPNTVLNGQGAPDNALGNPDDFYIDTLTMYIYGPKTEIWGAAISLKGKDGVVLKGDRGEKGDNIKGDLGPIGPKGLRGEVGPIGPMGKTGLQGPSGRDGIGLNGKQGPAGIAAPKIILGRNRTHIQWRYENESAWRDLLAIPKSKSSGGGAYEFKHMLDVDLTGLQNGYVLIYNSTTKKWEPGAGGGGGPSEKFGTLSTSAALDASDTNTVYDNTGATALVVADLPPAAQGLKFTFLVTDVDGFQLNADGTNIIRIAGSSSSAGGTQTCTQIGGSVTIYGYTGGWIASSSERTWIEA